jgi:hypothetical protein
MPKVKVQPPAPPDVKASRETEKVVQAHAALAQADGEESGVEEVRGHLHDALESVAAALNLLDDLEVRT